MYFKRFTSSGFTYLETVVALGVFTYLLFVSFDAIIVALTENTHRSQDDTLSLELHGPLMRTFGAYIRQATGIWYADNAGVGKEGTLSITRTGEHSIFDRQCSDDLAQRRFDDRLSLYLSHDKSDYITFAVEVDPNKHTSRMVYKRKGDDFWRYMHSEETYITCFLVSPSYKPSSVDAPPSRIDIQPYVDIHIAAAFRDEGLSSSEYIPRISYRTTYTLRNYSF